MKSIMVSDNLHKWIMDHKDSEKNSAEKVIYGLIGENRELIDQVIKISEIAENYKITIDEWNAQHLKKESD